MKKNHQHRIPRIFGPFTAACMQGFEMKRSALVKLYELGKISSGMAAKVLELSRIDFLDLLAAYSVSSLGVKEPDDLNEDIENA